MWGSVLLPSPAIMYTPWLWGQGLQVAAVWIAYLLVASHQTLFNDGQPRWQQHMEVLIPVVAARWTLFSEGTSNPPLWQQHMEVLLSVVAAC